MDHAVALVQAYLRANGYFTVTEYPVVEQVQHGDFRTATDIDVVAYRLPSSGGLEPATRPGEDGARRFIPDPELGAVPERADMLIAEVKEGRAELNRGARNPSVLAAVLMRFGACRTHEAQPVVDSLLRRGRARLPSGAEVRLVAFGAVSGPRRAGAYERVSMQHVVAFLRRFMVDHWSLLRHVQIKDPAFGFLATLEKAAGREPRSASEPS